MATALETAIREPEYINYLKAGLALKELQKGLSPFITRTLRTIHRAMISRVGGSSCGSCTLETLQLHANCKTRGCLCTKRSLPPGRRLCTTNTCNRLYGELISLYRFRNPEFKNIALQKVYTDSWAFGKCFLPPSGYGTKPSAAECDATGLLSIIINCTEFAPIVAATICVTPPKDVFNAVKDIRNSVMHTTCLEMSSGDMEINLDQMVQVLQHGAELQNDVDAQNAVSQILKLKDSNFQVTQSMEKSFLEEKFKAVEEKLEQMKLDVSQNKEEIEKLKDSNIQVTQLVEKCVPEESFKTVEEKLEQLKLEGSQNKEEIAKLQTLQQTQLDQTAYLEVQTSQDIQYIRQRIVSLEDKQDELLEQFSVDKELKRLIGDTEGKLKRHRDAVKDENLNIKSRLTTSLADQLKKKKILVLTGKSGIGKTHQAFNILTLLQETIEHKPVIVTKMSEIRSILSDDQPICILVNDIIGRFSVDKVLLDEWNSYIDTCVTHVQNRKLMLIITINSALLRQCSKEPVYNFFKEYSADLELDGLTLDEKEEMMHHFDIRPVIDMREKLLNEQMLPLGLPLLCKLAKGKTDKMWMLIKEPLKDTIEKMEPTSIIALLMTLFSGGTVSASTIKEDINGHLSTIFRKLTGYFEINTTDTDGLISKSGLVSRSNSLVGSFLQKSEDGTFNFIHDSVLEATFKTAIAFDLTDLLIEYCHISILLKLGHHLQKELSESLTKRLLARLETEQQIPVTCLGDCPLWFDTTFQQRAVEYFKSKMEFFLKKDEEGKSLFVLFAGLGLNWLVKVVLDKTKMSLGRDSTDTFQQVRLALLEACSHGNIDCVASLLQEPDVSVSDEHLFYSLRSEKEDMFDFLLEKGASIEAKDSSNGRNLIHESCIKNRPAIVKKVVLAMGNELSKTFLNMKTSVSKRTPLCYAVQHCDIDTVKFLLQSKSDVNVVDKTGKTLLHLALLDGKDSVIDHLHTNYPWMIKEVSNDGKTCLYCATCRGDLKYIKCLIHQGLDPNTRTSDRFTLLHAASRNGHSHVVEYLCKRYPGMLNQTDTHGRNAGHTSAARGHLDCLQRLLQEGTDPMSRGSSQFTLLHYAAYRNQPLIVGYLCSNYPSMINLTNALGRNAAHYAASKGHLDCLQRLLNEGIDPMTRDSKQLTLLHCAASNDQPLIVGYLCNRYPGMVNLTDTLGWSAAHYAASKGHLDCLQRLLNEGIDPMTRDSKQWTLLHCAASNDQPLIVGYLCNSYPSMVNLTNTFGRNAAHYAAALGHLDCLQRLLNEGIDPMSRDLMQLTLLHHATARDKPLIVGYLCNSYPDMLNLTDTLGQNAAYYADALGHLDCLQRLLNEGTDPMTRDSKQRTLLHCAALNDQPLIVGYLFNSYPDMLNLTDTFGWNAAHYAAALGHLDCLQRLLNEGIDPMSRDSKQLTLLHYATARDKPLIVGYLCNSYPDMLNLTDTLGRTAAHYAAAKGHLDCLQRLLNEGVDPMSRDSEQLTLLHHASSNDQPLILEYLCNSYPDMLNLTDTLGRTAAHYAAAKGHLDCLQRLLNEGVDPMSTDSNQSTLLHHAALNDKPLIVGYLCNSYPGMVNLTDTLGRSAAHYAVTEGHLDCLQRLLNEGIDPMSRDSKQLTLLHYATARDKPLIVGYLCNSYPDMLNLTDTLGRTAAHYAAAKGHLDCLQRLLNEGVDPMSRDSEQLTLLHHASSNDQPLILEYLCNSYPDMLNLTDTLGRTAAHYAAAKGHLDCLQRLLNEGVDPMSTDSNQSTLLHHAALNDKPLIVGYLCNSYPGMVNLTDTLGRSAAHYAVTEGHLDCLQRLLNEGIDPMTRDSKQGTLLHHAALNDKPLIVGYLCNSYPGMVNLTDTLGRNAAHYSAAQGHLDCLQRLFNEGIDPMSRDSKQRTLLHCAALNDQPLILGYLCNSYPDLVNLTDTLERNAAHFAAAFGHLDCLQRLLNEGIDPMSRDSEQWTLLHHAALNDKPLIVGYLCNSYPDMVNLTDTLGLNAAHHSAARGHLDCLQRLLNEGTDPMSRGFHQLTLLHMAALYDQPLIVEYLCNNYPGMINLSDTLGRNAAHYAAALGHLDCLQRLLNEGIDPMSRDLMQLTLLHHATARDKPLIVGYLCNSYPDMLNLTDTLGQNAAYYADALGHLDCLQRLLNEGTDPMTRDSKQRTLLHCAALNDQPLIVGYLFNSYPDMLNLTDTFGWNAAHYAAALGHLDCLQRLLNEGIDPMSRDSKQLTLLHYATARDKPLIVGYLCNSYPDMLNLTDTLGRTAAHYAAAKGHLDCLQRLLNEGVDPMSRDSEQLTLLHHASSNDQPLILEYLCNSYPDMLNLTDTLGRTAAHYAAAKGHLDCLQRLLNEGVDPMSTDSNQSTLLHHAALNDKPLIVGYLCNSYPGMVNLTDTLGRSAAHYAVTEGHLDCLQRLLNEGIDPMSRDSKQLTLLHYATARDKPLIVGYLCNSYPDMLNLTDTLGRTAAHYAAAKGHLDCLQRLLNEGVDPMSRDSEQLTLLHHASSNDQPLILEYLCNSYPDMLNLTDTLGRTAAHYAAAKGHLDCLQRLLNEGVDPMSTDSNQSTLLHHAALNDKPLIVGYLCNSYPGMVNLTDTLGRSAAHYAVTEGHLDCLQRLLNEGIDPMTRDSKQGTLLHHAALNDKPLIVGYLCNSYPDLVNLTDTLGRNAAHYSAAQGHLDCLQRLFNEGIDPMSRDSKQRTLLHCAALNDQPLILGYLCNSYPDLVNLTDTLERNAAHFAAAFGHLDCLQRLLNEGIDPMSRDSEQWTLLHHAALNDKPLIVGYLCNSYPDMVNLTDTLGLNAAHHSAARGHLDCLQRLLNEGTDPMSRGFHQLTLLHMAALYDQPLIVEYLCNNYPGMINLSDTLGRNAAQCAAVSGHRDCLLVMDDHGTPPTKKYKSS